MTNFFLPNDDPATSIDSLNNGLKKLTLGNNFHGFFADIEVAAGDEARIRNGLRDFIPSGFFVTSIEGQNTLVRGDTEWTLENLYLKNKASTSTVVATVFFLK